MFALQNIGCTLWQLELERSAVVTERIGDDRVEVGGKESRCCVSRDVDKKEKIGKFDDLTRFVKSKNGRGKSVWVEIDWEMNNDRRGYQD
jgi:hypothetical protein